MKSQLEKLLKESAINLESNAKIQEMIVHNIGYYLQIHSSYKICKEHFHNFDFRSEYWWKPEIRLLGKYYMDYFLKDFFPPEELRKLLLEVFREAKGARKSGKFNFVPANTAFYKPDIFKRIGAELEKVILAKNSDSKVVRDAHARSFKGAKSTATHLAEYVRWFCEENEDSKMNGSLINRFQFIPYYLANDLETLKKATFFMGAFYTLFTATNAYQTGAAQNFGPILGNNSTKQFLDFVDKWMQGESISKTGFWVHDSDSKEPQDKSEYVAILEVHGFARLHEIPYVNTVVLANYRNLFEFNDGDGKQVQQKVGETVRAFLKNDDLLVSQLSKLWDKYLSVAKGKFALHFEPEKIQKQKQLEQYSSQLMNNEFLDEYKKHIPLVGTQLGAIEKAQALMHLCLDANAYLEAEENGKAADYAEELISNSKVNYWSIAPGEGAQYWGKWQGDKNVSIGWNEMGDLSQYKNLEEVKEKYIELYKPKTDDPKNDTLALFEFRHKLKPGDIVFVKSGRTKLLGVGKITSDYQYINPPKYDCHIRGVNWLKIGDWDLVNDKFAIKALTNITAYPDFVDNLLKLAGVDVVPRENGGIVKSDSKLPVSKNIIYWGPPGTGKTFKLIEMQGLFRDRASTQDEIVSWIQELGWWDVIAAALIDIGKPVTVPNLFEHEFVRVKVKLQSGNKTPKNTLWGLLQAHTVNTSKTVNFEKRQEPLVVDKSEDSKWSLVGDWEEQLDDLVKDVKRIRSGNSDTVNERFKVVTFHQSYSYEEFVEGIRPERLADGSGVNYQVKDGVFKLLCQRAAENPEKEYAIFIDEINRGNISKIFGELITLIEEDKRIGAPHEITITLPYSGKRFGVPSNLYVIGTMNSVDRSIALVDMALRRRFEFISVRPNPELIAPVDLGGINIRKVFEKINQKIAVILGTEYQIGHSYFMGRNVGSISSFKKTWFGSILPLLQEYLFDDWDKIEALAGDFVLKTEVKDLEKLSLPKFSFGSFISGDIADDKFIELLRKLE